MKTLTTEQMEAVSGGGFWKDMGVMFGHYCAANYDNPYWIMASD
jgi:bacteriocin-like protein